MAKPSISEYFYGVLLIVFLLSVHEIRVEAKECSEGLPWVETECRGSVPAGNCWVECQKRHGFDVKASCSGFDPNLPKLLYCWCSWPC